MTINAFDRGKVIYIGTMGDSSFYAGITKWILEMAGISPLLDTPAGVEVTERWQDGVRLLFILNHNDGARDIALDAEYIEIKTGETISGTVSLPPRGVMILSPQRQV